jgi:thymidine kinase
MKTICWFCHKKAIMNLHYIDGKPVYEGAQVQIGGNEAYYPVCRHHYFHPEI